MDTTNENKSAPSGGQNGEIPEAERRRLLHLSEELDVQFDLNAMSPAEAKQLIGELEKRAAREGHEE